MKRYEAVIHYGPDDEQKRGGFRTLVAAVRWITARRLGLSCWVADERGVVCYERP